MPSKDSVRILTPIIINTAPPAISDLFPKRFPHLLPIYTPARDMKKVTIPITAEEKITGTFMVANVTPAAKASILVAIAKTVRVEMDSGFFISSVDFSFIASYIILHPMNTRRVKAIQWSKASMNRENVLPKR